MHCPDLLFWGPNIPMVTREPSLGIESPTFGSARRGECFLGGFSGKESTGQWRRRKRRGFDPWVRKISWRRSWQPTPVFLPGEGHGNPLQYSCLENPIDRGAWWAMVHEVAKGWTRLKWLSTRAAVSPGFFVSNWSIVALQCCISFFCTAKWISSLYTYIPRVS